MSITSKPDSKTPLQWSIYLLRQRPDSVHNGESRKVFDNTPMRMRIPSQDGRVIRKMLSR